MLFQQNANLLSTVSLQDISDSQPGTSFTSPTGGQPFAGLIGQCVQLNDPQALLHSDTTVSTLYGGVYQYVLFKSGSTAANAKGQIVFYSSVADRATFTVTPDPPAVVSWVAGVTLGAVTKGQYGWIQIAGLANVLCKATVTDTTAGDIGFVVSDSSIGKVDANLVGSVTAAQQAVKIGVFLDAPANAGFKRMWIVPTLFHNCY
jgi:hypothetical protein